ncbi:receptor-like protein kinase HSL1 [Macadamia integrifolia]|uniref:receptor-like protein kinase HSL1 n=1 Tax=Macadamia integrifolia TaxID=60698 RepID=UPI001C52AAFE|nr:receptor-like protein kinase HSL1 [Macadamia integrifolia]
MSKISFPSLRILLSLFLLFILSLPFLVDSQHLNPELSILLKLKQSWGDPPSLQHWNSSSNPCKWPEIYCSTGSVTGLYLTNTGIAEQIPPFICDLKNLTHIDLSFNNIPGEFPTLLYNCSNLDYLDLSENLFVGEIPANVDKLSGLQLLNLGSNNFTGNIPPAIGLLSGLQFLCLSYNLFNGSYPSEIVNLAKLEVLDMSCNQFTAARIPLEFMKLKKLKQFFMKDTNLIGEIPVTIGELTELESLDLSGNSLNGTIPSGLLLLKNLKSLYLYFNHLSGEIPSTIETFSLINIDISRNRLMGRIPEDFGKLRNLTSFDMYGNQLSGEIPAGLGQITTLQEIRLFQNNLTGVLPPDLGLYSKLQTLEVCNNHLTGSLPENLCAGGVFTGLSAYSNDLTGGLPKSFGNCSTLNAVLLYRNRLSGKIPASFWSSENLSYLSIQDNLFSGELPSQLARNFSRLEISNNRFSGGIPSQISASTNLQVFTASNNLFSGNIPSGLTDLPHLNTLSLDGNNLSGPIPSEIASWKFLSTLNLSRNQLSGQIPSVIGLLPDLNSLDLSQNQLSGEIPFEIGSLKPTYLNLSSNQLAGKIPSTFENMAYDESFLNNPNLCADNQNLNIQPCKLISRESKRLSSRLLAILLVLAGVMFIVIVLSSLFLIRDYRRRKLRNELATWKLTSFQRLGFTESVILSNLTESNLIGSGGSGKVYCVPFNRSGEVVAVKKIWNSKSLDQKQEKEFEAEVKILGTIRHSSIVKLLCCLSSENSKLLVYEYLENRSLDRWLHRKNGGSMVSGSVHPSELDWPKRMQIAVGAAQGLCYMHHDCSPPIVHRDVKSSNILLDSDFKARIADFGLAKLLLKPGDPTTMSSVAGSFGYFAPELAYTTKVNEKIDVYSFGVVLLELATGREANDGDESMCLAEWAWRHFQDGKSITDALDDRIKEPCNLDEMSVVFKLGLICTGTLPSTRPSMKDVLQILVRCEHLRTDGEKAIRSERDIAPLLGTTKYLASYKGSRHKISSSSDDDDDIDSLGCNV